MEFNREIFREYDIRGVAETDFSNATLSGLSRALGTYLLASDVQRVAVGRDCRTSSDRIATELKKGLVSTGLTVIDVGLVPTPLLYFAVPELSCDAGIMITGSHNPPEYNGFKIAVGTGTLFGHQIQEIRQLLEKGEFTVGLGQELAQPIQDTYLEKVTAGIEHPLKLKVVVDSGNGMAGLVAPELFRRLGCEVIELYSEPDGRFPNHHPDPTVEANLLDLIQTVKKTGAIVGVGFDGDADRIGAVDPTGRMLYGDELLALFSRQVLKKNPGATILSDVKASHRLFDDIRKHGGKPILWKTGHSLIKAKMKEEGALLGGEMSGHIFFKDRYYGFDDAIYAAARLFEIISESGKTPVQLLSDLPPSFSTPEIRVDCPDHKKFSVVQSARKELESRGYRVNAIDGARVEFEDGWGLVRASNTQPVLVFRFEANSQHRLTEIQALIQGIVLERLS